MRKKNAKRNGSARLQAAELLLKLEDRNIPLNVAMGDIPQSQRGEVKRLSAGVLRHRTICENAVKPLLKKSFAKLDVEIATIFRLAAYEKYFCGAPIYAITNEYVGMARRLNRSSASSLVNAVLRRLPEKLLEIPRKQTAKFLSAQYSFPRWMTERWIAQFGFDKAEKICAASNTDALLHLRVNSQLTSREKVLLSLQKRGVTAHAGDLSPDSIIVESVAKQDGEKEVSSFTTWAEWRRGEITAQDEAAQMVSVLANPQRGWTVYDLCAAPGGKTTHLMQLMGEGNLQAFDISAKRLRLVRENCRRLQQEKVLLRAGDFRSLQLSQADLVLLDAPCSGTGTLRRHPDIKWSKSLAQIQQLVELQRELLEDAAKLVRCEGFLVYSTCSVEREENAGQIQQFLQRHSDWIECDRWQNLPGNNDMDGAFAVKMQRIK